MFSILITYIKHKSREVTQRKLGELRFVIGESLVQKKSTSFVLLAQGHSFIQSTNLFINYCMPGVVLDAGYMEINGAVSAWSFWSNDEHWEVTSNYKVKCVFKSFDGGRDLRDRPDKSLCSVSIHDTLKSPGQWLVHVVAFQQLPTPAVAGTPEGRRKLVSCLRSQWYLALQPQVKFKSLNCGTQKQQAARAKAQCILWLDKMILVCLSH